MDMEHQKNSSKTSTHAGTEPSRNSSKKSSANERDESSGWFSELGEGDPVNGGDSPVHGVGSDDDPRAPLLRSSSNRASDVNFEQAAGPAPEYLVKIALDDEDQDEVREDAHLLASERAPGRRKSRTRRPGTAVYDFIAEELGDHAADHDIVKSRDPCPCSKDIFRRAKSRRAFLLGLRISLSLLAFVKLLEVCVNFRFLWSAPTIGKQNASEPQGAPTNYDGVKVPGVTSLDSTGAVSRHYVGLFAMLVLPCVAKPAEESSGNPPAAFYLTFADALRLKVLLSLCFVSTVVLLCMVFDKNCHRNGVPCLEILALLLEVGYFSTIWSFHCTVGHKSLLPAGADAFSSPFANIAHANAGAWVDKLFTPLLSATLISLHLWLRFFVWGRIDELKGMRGGMRPSNLEFASTSSDGSSDDFEDDNVQVIRVVEASDVGALVHTTASVDRKSGKAKKNQATEEQLLPSPRLVGADSIPETVPARPFPQPLDFGTRNGGGSNGKNGRMNSPVRVVSSKGANAKGVLESDARLTAQLGSGYAGGAAQRAGGSISSAQIPTSAAEAGAPMSSVYGGGNQSLGGFPSMRGSAVIEPAVRQDTLYEEAAESNAIIGGFVSYKSDSRIPKADAGIDLPRISGAQATNSGEGRGEYTSGRFDGSGKKMRGDLNRKQMKAERIKNLPGFEEDEDFDFLRYVARDVQGDYLDNDKRPKRGGNYYG